MEENTDKDIIVLENSTKTNSTTRKREPVEGNFVQGELRNQELTTFFHNNQELLQDTKNQLSNYRTEDLYCISYNDAKITATNAEGKQVNLDSQLESFIKSYFFAVGAHNNPKVFINDESVRGYSSIDFSFRLPDNVNKGIRYSPEYRNENWEHIEGDWYIYSEGLI